MARGRHAKKIDTVHWTTSSLVSSIGQAAGTVGVNLMAAQHLPETLLRLRGSWSANIDGVNIPEEGIEIVCGIILVPDGTGTTVLWSPLSDGDAPWIWWDVVYLVYEEAVVDTVASQNTFSAIREIDSKAMRHIRNTELQFVIERVAMTGLITVPSHVTARVRALSGS